MLTNVQKLHCVVVIIQCTNGAARPAGRVTKHPDTHALAHSAARTRVLQSQNVFYPSIICMDALPVHRTRVRIGDKSKWIYIVNASRLVNNRRQWERPFVGAHHAVGHRPCRFMHSQTQHGVLNRETHQQLVRGPGFVVGQV